jgi:hypothetical protein
LFVFEQYPSAAGHQGNKDIHIALGRKFFPNR